MNELTLLSDVVFGIDTTITKDLNDQKAAHTRLKPSVKRKSYAAPRVDDLGNIWATTFQTSITLG